LPIVFVALPIVFASETIVKVTKKIVFEPETIFLWPRRLSLRRCRLSLTSRRFLCDADDLLYDKANCLCLFADCLKVGQSFASPQLVVFGARSPLASLLIQEIHQRIQLTVTNKRYLRFTKYVKNYFIIYRNYYFL